MSTLGKPNVNEVSKFHFAKFKKKRKSTMLNTADEVSFECSSADLKVRTILDAFIADLSTEWVC